MSQIMNTIIFFCVITLTLTKLTFSSIHPMFKACEPQRCENSQNITYPFFITGKQPSYCGYPRFELTCGSNGFPILNTSTGSQYTVHRIFYHNESLRVSYPAFSQLSEQNTTQCIAETRNFSRYSKRFSVAPKQKELLLFYGCDSRSFPEDRIIGCSVTNRSSSVVGLYREDKDLSIAWKNCNGKIVSTRVEDERGGIKEALQRGFVLNWTATNCDQCQNSGGRCGFNLNRSIYAFRCYCPDDVYVDKCNPSPYSPG
ncbi:hypothetical protein VNO77_41851 [Canavalia gladiata]|uniref:non-specific serine/threonine protein kinase n=1 Tax=Canavalia gladiata TaxID=3824 RepID=A0AAN9K1A8_CANGL